MFLCCHPGLPLASQVVLTLKTVGGLGVDEIAAALLAKPAAVAQRLVRAKRWLRDEPRPASTSIRPGWTACSPSCTCSSAPGTTRPKGTVRCAAELCGEAIRLCRLLCADRGPACRGPARCSR